MKPILYCLKCLSVGASPWLFGTLGTAACDNLESEIDVIFAVM